MTDPQTAAMQALLTRVEAGDDFTGDALNRAVDAMKSFTPSMTTYEFAVRFRDAQRNSLDAAKALHDAVLPGWKFGIYEPQPGIYRAYVCKWSIMRPMPTACDAADPARAWLIAVLRALIAKGNSDE